MFASSNLTIRLCTQYAVMQAGNSVSLIGAAIQVVTPSEKQNLYQEGPCYRGFMPIKKNHINIVILDSSTLNMHRSSCKLQTLYHS